MEKFDDATLVEFLRRSYFTVDGLWFVKLEEKESFERALELDEAVWKVMPKIQARKARQLLGVQGTTLQDLVKCFSLKLTAEDFAFATNWISDGEVELLIDRCPWYAILTHSGRENLAGAIADSICTNEYAGWTQEFAEALGFKLEKRLCTGDGRCVIRLTDRRETPSRPA